MTLQTKIDTQTALEDVSFLTGVERYKDAQNHRAIREGFERRDDVTKLIRGAIPILSAAISAWMTHADAGKGRKPAGLKALKVLNPDVVALLALSRTFNALGKGGSITAITIAIGRGIEVEIEAIAIDETDPKAAQRFRDLVDGESRPGIISKRHAALAEKLEISLNWDDRRRMLTGDIVLGLILTSLSEVFIRGMGTTKTFPMPIIQLTDAASEALAEMTEAAALPLEPIKEAARSAETRLMADGTSITTMKPAKSEESYAAPATGAWGFSETAPTASHRP